MQDKTRNTLKALGKSVLYGAAVAAGLAAFTFLFAFLTGGFSWALGLDWARRLLYVIGAVCVIAAGAGLFFSGDGAAHRDQRIGFKKDETLSSFEHAQGISWPWALLAGCIAFFVLGAMLDLILAALA